MRDGFLLAMALCCVIVIATWIYAVLLDSDDDKKGD